MTKPSDDWTNLKERARALWLEASQAKPTKESREAAKTAQEIMQLASKHTEGE